MLFLWTTFVLLLAICCARTEKAGMSQFDSMKSTDGEFVQKLLKERFNWKYFIEALQQHEKSHVDMKVDPCLLSFVQIDREELLKALDASWKMPAGLLDGNIYWLGDYRECMSTKNFHYCTMADILLFNKMPLTAGMCIPEKCNEKDINTIFSLLSKISKINNTAMIKEQDNYQLVEEYGTDHKCYSKTISYSSGFYAMVVISVLIVLLSLYGAATEIMRNGNIKYHVLEDDIAPADREEKTGGSSLQEFFLCFSFIKNTKAVLRTDVADGAITSLNGIRVISITWVIMGHCLVFSLPDIDNINVWLHNYLPRFTMQAITNATLSVDTFFLIGGILLGYLNMRKLQAKGRLNLVQYYGHRYVRLTPTYLYVILFIIYVFPFLGNGPQWFMEGPDSNQSRLCVKYWWTNIFYISNFYPTEVKKMCMNWSWYLANDMQFYVISPIILFAMYKFKWIGAFVANGVLLLACFIASGVLIDYYDASPLFFENNELSLIHLNSPNIRYVLHLYMKPYIRIGPYVVGIMMGYFLLKKCSYKWKFQKAFHGFGWLLSTAIALLVIYGPYTSSSYAWGEKEHLLYGIFFRFAWAVSLSWVIYACQNGFGGWVNGLLSWKVFLPLSRLTYSVYLVHPLVIQLFVLSSNIALDLTITNYVMLYINSLVISHAVAFLVVIFIEMPVANLENLVFPKQ